MIVLETDRLRLRWLSVGDASFIVELMNDPSWLRFIGDRGVRTVEDAESYLLSGPVDMYSRLGFGLYLAELRDGSVPIGICGLIKRDSLDDVDIGFAFLPRYWSQGYAYESASAVMDYGRNVLGLRRIVAITKPENAASTKLLEKLGLCLEKMIRLSNEGEEVCLYAREA